jgi:hypothetical protein
MDDLLGARAGRDGEGHGQRHGHHADHDARYQVGKQLLPGEQAGPVGFEKGDHWPAAAR